MNKNNATKCYNCWLKITYDLLWKHTVVLYYVMVFYHSGLTNTSVSFALVWEGPANANKTPTKNSVVGCDEREHRVSLSDLMWRRKDFPGSSVSAKHNHRQMADDGRLISEARWQIRYLHLQAYLEFAVTKRILCFKSILSVRGLCASKV